MLSSIHIFAEVLEKGKWKLNKKPVFKNPWYATPEYIIEKQKKDPVYKVQDWEKDSYLPEPSRLNDIDWFAFLSGDDSFLSNSILKRSVVSFRGVPEDASAGWLKYLKSHSKFIKTHSYVYLKDFLNFEWEKHHVSSQVLIPAEDFESKNINLGLSSESTQDLEDLIIDEPQFSSLTKTEKDSLLYSSLAVNKKGHLEIKRDKILKYRLLVNCKCAISYRDYLDGYFISIINPMIMLKTLYDDVRLVFAFS